MSKSRKKGYELMSEIALAEIVGAIRKAGALSAPEIMAATGRSRGNVDGYLRELEEGGHVLRGLPPVSLRKGGTFSYSAPVGQVRELPCRKCGQSGEPKGGEYPCSVCGRPTMHDPAPTLGLERCEKHQTLRDPKEEPCWQCENELATPVQLSQVVNESKSGPIPAHPRGNRPETLIEKRALVQCALAGVPLSDEAKSALPSAIRAVREAYGKIPYDPTDLDDDKVLARVAARPHPADKLPEPFRSNEKIRDAEAKRERRDDRRWRAGFTHLTKGGDFELRDDGGGKTSIRRVTVDGAEGTRYSAPVQLPTTDALAMFVEASKPAPGPLNQPEGEVWITPAPSTAPVPKPRPRKTGADDLGHFGQGSSAADTDADEQADAGGES